LKPHSAGPRSRTSLCWERSRPIHGALTRFRGISKNHTDAWRAWCDCIEFVVSISVFYSLFSAGTASLVRGISKTIQTLEQGA
jgi:hypothetical protein